jgi:hypothetical protein
MPVRSPGQVPWTRKRRQQHGTVTESDCPADCFEDQHTAHKLRVGWTDRRGRLDARQRRERNGEYDGRAGRIVVIGPLPRVAADRRSDDPDHRGHQQRRDTAGGQRQKRPASARLRRTCLARLHRRRDLPPRQCDTFSLRPAVVDNRSPGTFHQPGPTISHEPPCRLLSADRKQPNFVSHTLPEEPVDPDAAAVSNEDVREQLQVSARARFRPLLLRRCFAAGIVVSLGVSLRRPG